MDLHRLVRMANQIGDFFETEADHAAALGDIAGHIRRFWDPRMRREILQRFSNSHFLNLCRRRPVLRYRYEPGLEYQNDNPTHHVSFPPCLPMSKLIPRHFQCQPLRLVPNGGAHQNLRSELFALAQQAKHQVLGTDIVVAQPAGLVDGVEVSLIPVLLGGGIPLLPPPASRATLKLRKQRVYETTGTIGLEYDIVRR